MPFAKLYHGRKNVKDVLEEVRKVEGVEGAEASGFYIFLKADDTTLESLKKYGEVKPLQTFG